MIERCDPSVADLSDESMTSGRDTYHGLEATHCLGGCERSRSRIHAIPAAPDDARQTRSSSPNIACTKVEPVSSFKIPYLHYSTPGAVANRTMTKLDDQIAQHRKELECHVALFDLAETLRKRSEETSAVAALGEAIALHRSALDLRQTGHPGH